MTDLEKKINECVTKFINRVNVDGFKFTTAMHPNNFCNSPEFKELAEWISREAVENCEWFVSPKYDNEEVRFNVDWFDGLWSEK